MSRFLIAFCILAATASGSAFAQAFQPVDGTSMIETSDYGSLPKEIVWKKDGAVMVLIPAGSSRLGQTAGAGVPDTEVPEVAVSLGSFYIDKFEVSNKQYTEFAKKAAATMPMVGQRMDLVADELPAVAITWSSAADYAKWALKELPTEAMWEKAARGPGGALYPPGGPGNLEAYVIGRGVAGAPDAANAQTTDVSPYGVNMMAGNVREWVDDWYGRFAYKNMAADSPRGPTDGFARVVRGGSYMIARDADAIRLTRRGSTIPTQMREDLGFRTVFILRPAPPETPVPPPTPTYAPDNSSEESKAAIDAVMAALAANAPGPPEPRNAMGGPATAGDEGQIGNFAPVPLRIAFVTTDGRVEYFARVLPPCSFTVMQIPNFGSSARMHLLASPVTANPRVNVIDLGEIASIPGQITVLPGAYFVETFDYEGKALPAPTATDALQFYEGSFSPQWNELDFRNDSELPVSVMVEAAAPGPNAPAPRKLVIEPGQTMSGRMPAGIYSVAAQYLGVEDAPTSLEQFEIGLKAAHRLIRVAPDMERSDRIRVFAKMLPFVKCEVIEARAHVIATRGKATPAPKATPRR